MAALSKKQLTDCLDPLFRFALSLTRNEDRARDLVQDCVERCLRKQDLFDGKNLQAWLFTMCHRIFLNARRKESRQGIHMSIDEAEWVDRLAHLQQDDHAIMMDLAKAIETLPEADSRLLSMVVVRGVPYQEAAHELDLPIGTVRSRLSRVRTRLKRQMLGPADNVLSGTGLAA